MTPAEQDPVTPRGRYAKGVARRQEILERAREVFAQRGADRTSLRAIAREVGVTHAALTHYFGSLEELLIAVYEDSEQQPDRIASRRHTSSPVDAMVGWARQNRSVPGLVQLYAALVSAALERDHPAATAFATRRFDRVRADLARQVRDAQGEGFIRDDLDADDVAALLVGASDGLQTQWLLDERVDLERVLPLLGRLLAPAAPPTSPLGAAVDSEG